MEGEMAVRQVLTLVFTTQIREAVTVAQEVRRQLCALAALPVRLLLPLLLPAAPPAQVARRLLEIDVQEQSDSQIL
jgi:hypothetical protein